MEKAGDVVGLDVSFRRVIQLWNPALKNGTSRTLVLNLQLLKGLSLWLNGLRQSGAVLSLRFVGSYALSQIPVQFEPAKYERMVFGLILILMMIIKIRKGKKTTARRQVTTQLTASRFCKKSDPASPPLAL